ncbi:MAG: hypothetical protein L6U99_13965 [Clostridium sp.]|nr:MAG: hypothetical protein L6U99_13965 [Clostridium sp.]
MVFLFSVATGNTSNLTNAFICGPKEAISIFFNTAYTLIFLVWNFANMYRFWFIKYFWVEPFLV